MLKRILKIGMIASVMMCSFSAFAQNEDQMQAQPKYPHYGFWSNWSIGINGGVTIPMGDKFEGQKNDPSYGFGAYFSKELNYVWDLRLQATMHDIDNGMGKSGSLGVGFSFSIIDAIKGYNPNRAWRLYIMAGAGMGIDENGVIVDKYGKIYYLANAGLGLSWQFAKDWKLALESNFYLPGDLANPFEHFAGYYNYTSLGIAYNFGITQTDKDRIAQEAMLTQENFDALTQENDQVKKELESARNNEQALKNKVAALESNQNKKDNTMLEKDQKELAALRNQINQMKKEQLNFYALPLSIQYAIDQYTISPVEMKKMEAIARVMKDNPDYKFTIVGFADYTGTPAYNEKLSQKRAEEAKKVLVNKYGINADRLTISGKGQSDSFGDVKFSINRRVSFYRVIE